MVRGHGWVGWGGKKKRQRGGASEAEGGLWGQEMDGNILFFPPLRSLPLFLTLSCGSRLQQSCVAAGKTERSTKVGFSSKDTVQCLDQSACLHTTYPRGDAAQEEVDAVQFLIFAQFSLFLFVFPP